MKGCGFRLERYPPPTGLKPGTARSARQHFNLPSYWGSWIWAFNPCLEYMINIKFQFYFRHLKVELVPCRLKTTVDILRLHYSLDLTVSVSDQGTLYKKRWVFLIQKLTCFPLRTGEVTDRRTDGHTGVCNYGYVPLSVLGNTVMRKGQKIADIFMELFEFYDYVIIYLILFFYYYVFFAIFVVGNKSIKILPFRKS